jgi:hypothetical protein
MPYDPNAPVGVALALGSLAVATNLRISEPAGSGRDRMGRAAETLAENLRVTSGELIAGEDLITSFSKLVASVSEPDRRALLIELAVANPFSPYWFATTERREVCRLTALTLIAALSLNLEPDSVSVIDTAWRKLAKDLVPVGLSAPAGPLVALAMPAAAGLNATAAMSTGLQQLAIAPIGSGGLGVVAGQWLLGAAGIVTAGSTAAVISSVVGQPGAAHWLELELYKLVLTTKLAETRGWFDISIARAARAVEHVSGEVIAELESALARNDPKAMRVRELRELGSSCLRAAEKIARLRERADLGPRRPGQPG